MEDEKEYGNEDEEEDDKQREHIKIANYIL